MRQSEELQIGKDGEYLVCADLILKGLIAYPSEQGLPYDVVLDNGRRLLKVQVKTTRTHRTIPQRHQESKAYIFNIKRAGKNNLIRYDESEIDIFALVSLDTMQVGYLWNKDMPETLNVRVDSLRGSYKDERGVKQCSDIKKLMRRGKSQSEVARELGLHVSTVNRHVLSGCVPHVTNAKYMSDLARDKSWFYV